MSTEKENISVAKSRAKSLGRKVSRSGGHHDDLLRRNAIYAGG
jgi:hypothetical protein